jgi:DNA primase
LYKVSYWLRHENPEIAKLVAEIETEQHELSPYWLLKYNVLTNGEVDKLKTAVMNAVYEYKKNHILIRINDIQKELSKYGDGELSDEQRFYLAEQNHLERVKMLLAGKLNQTIIY